MPAAVLLPLVLRAEPMVLLTERTHTLSRHAGQVSFPGGRAEAGDISLVETAMRGMPRLHGRQLAAGCRIALKRCQSHRKSA